MTTHIPAILNLAIGILFTLLPPRVAAQESADSREPRPSIRVAGEATIQVAPDEAWIEISVVSSATSAKAAAAANAQQSDTVVSELRRIVGDRDQITTVSYTVTPEYRYPKEGGKPSITGYSVTNSVQVRTTNLEQVGRVIDAATQTGANRIQQLRFDLRDRTAAEATALRKAAEAARAKAQAVAEALGLRISRVLRAEESTTSLPRPVHDRMLAAAATAEAASTPVDPGTVEIHATVQLTVEIGQ